MSATTFTVPSANRPLSVRLFLSLMEFYSLALSHSLSHAIGREGDGPRGAPQIRHRVPGGTNRSRQSRFAPERTLCLHVFGVGTRRFRGCAGVIPGPPRESRDRDSWRAGWVSGYSSSVQ